MPDDIWLDSIVAQLARQRDGHALTYEMLRRSREQLDLSFKILNIDVPAIWPREKPTLTSKSTTSNAR
jgi:hypothetical protein